MGEEGSQKVDQEEPVPSGEEKGKVVEEKAGEDKGKVEEEKAGEDKGKVEEEKAGEDKGKVEDLAAETVPIPTPRQKSFPEVDETVDAGTNSIENQRLAKNATQEENKIRTPLMTQVAKPEVVKSTAVPLDRDAVLAQVANEKMLALIKAWEESEKTKADNKAHKRFSTVDSWENSKKAAVELELKQIEESFDKKKAEYAEKMKNKVAELHKAAEEKRATIEAERREEFHKVDQTASNFRASGHVPKKLFGCFGL